ncbi:hypothetical protein PROFUN_12508, partial [Planoprotostelium fungivorum]
MHANKSSSPAGLHGCQQCAPLPESQVDQFLRFLLDVVTRAVLALKSAT